jgi:hypothetical protein
MMHIYAMLASCVCVQIVRRAACVQWGAGFFIPTGRAGPDRTGGDPVPVRPEAGQIRISNQISNVSAFSIFFAVY